MTNSLLLKMAIEIVDFPIKDGRIFPSFSVNVYQARYPQIIHHSTMTPGDHPGDCRNEVFLNLHQKSTV